MKDKQGIPLEPQARAERLRKKAEWHIARAGSGGSWMDADRYTYEAELIESGKCPACETEAGRTERCPFVIHVHSSACRRTLGPG